MLRLGWASFGDPPRLVTGRLPDGAAEAVGVRRAVRSGRGAQAARVGSRADRSHEGFLHRSTNEKGTRGGGQIQIQTVESPPLAASIIIFTAGDTSLN